MFNRNIESFFYIYSSLYCKDISSHSLSYHVLTRQVFPNPAPIEAPTLYISDVSHILPILYMSGLEISDELIQL